MNVFDSLIKKITFKDLKDPEMRSTLCIVTVDDKRYGIAKWRLDKSSRKDDIELFISRDGKWLIPSDTVSEGAEVDW